MGCSWERYPISRDSIELLLGVTAIFGAFDKKVKRKFSQELGLRAPSAPH
jgi:hypothetical protein